MGKKIRNLKADEIECKVASINNKGLQLLLYKTARTDKAILDEVYGEDGWYNEFEEIKGNLYCSIFIWSEERKAWLKRQDCGVESAFGDKEKGEASDAFKRAGFKVGIGVELYTPIFIWVPVNDKKGEPNYDENYDKAKDKYSTWYTNQNIKEMLDNTFTIIEKL